MDTSTTLNQDMEKLATEKRKNVEALMTKLGPGEPEVTVYLCKDGKNEEIPKSDYGHFF